MINGDVGVGVGVGVNVGVNVEVGLPRFGGHRVSYAAFNLSSNSAGLLKPIEECRRFRL